MSEAAFARALSSLVDARRLGIDFGLERVTECLQQLKLTHTPLATVQIAGTNGKGSTAAFLAEVLRQADYRVGVFSSPHLLTIRERFCIDSIPISQAEFLRAHAAVNKCSTKLTFFEHITAMAAWLFDKANVDVAIYEVGLGGRLDSTTALPATLSVVTGIGLDHCEFLGDTLEEIALEKAGIFRKGVPAVIGLGADRAIRDLLTTKTSNPRWVGAEHMAFVPQSLELKGAYQRENAACAVAAVVSLREAGLSIDDAALRNGLGRATLDGRMQQVGEGLWLDGAHNPQAAQALAEQIASEAPWTLVVGLSNTKDIAGFLRPLLPHCTHLIATQATGDRSYPAAQVAAVAKELGMTSEIAEPDIEIALEKAQLENNKALVTGSLLLLGDVLTSLGHPGADSLLITDPSGGCSSIGRN